MDIVKILLLYIMVQNTKHRRNKRNKSVKKQKVRGGTRDGRNRHKSRVSTSRVSTPASVYNDSKPVPISKKEIELDQMKTSKYDTPELASEKALEIKNFIVSNFTELNQPGSWFKFTFQPEEKSFFTPKVIEKDGKYTIIITNSRYIF